MEDFVEVPSDVEDNDDAHRVFLESQAALRKKRLLEARNRKKRSRSEPDHEEEDDEQHVQEGDVDAGADSDGDPNDQDEEGEEVDEQHDDSSPEVLQEPDEDDALQDELKQQLLGARFRLLNEQLYSIPSHEAVAMFTEHPELFQVYHAGFADQVAKWPANPVDGMIAWLKGKPASLVVADFGCGDAALAAQVKQTVHSFDLVAANERVTACDMAHTPLADRSIDVAVFCLSLMGSNVEDFLREAHRVLRVGGTLLVAEVSSRLADWGVFVRAVQALGFSGGADKKAPKNTHFVQFIFAKTAKAPSQRPTGLALGVCRYKKRG